MADTGDNSYQRTMDISELTRRIEELANGFVRSQVLFTALRAGIFALLDEPHTADTIAQALGWHPRGVRMLLDGLVALELVEKKDALYRNTPIASQCLVPGASADQTHILEHKANGWATWSRLEEAVRTGAAIPREKPERSPEELRAFICGMGDIARLSAQAILDAVDISPYRRLLDVGAGPGTYTIAFLKHNSEMRATLFDLPEVIPIAREQVEQAKLLERVEFVPGDLTTDAFEQRYDLILISNIIHSYGSDTNCDLVRKCYEALQPGGLLIVKDFLVDSGRTGPAFSLLFALHMLLHTEAGDTYTTDEVGQWTTAAGFPSGQIVEITPQTRLWLVEKP